MTTPLVSVVVPTFNSEDTLDACLRSVKTQEYDPIELIVVDSGSSDKTLQIAERYCDIILTTNYRLLGSRYLGFMKSFGEWVFLLDSDQVLAPDAILKAMDLSISHDMIVLEEMSLASGTWVQHLFEADRKLIHRQSSYYIASDTNGILLARGYDRELLARAFEAIPKNILPFVIAHDHAIIHYEASRLGGRICVLPSSVRHIEVKDARRLLKKNYRYGVTTRWLWRSGYYRRLIHPVRQVRRMPTAFSIREFLQSTLLLAMKAIPYWLGFLAGH